MANIASERSANVAAAEDTNFDAQMAAAIAASLNETNGVAGTHLGSSNQPS